MEVLDIEIVGVEIMVVVVVVVVVVVAGVEVVVVFKMELVVDNAGTEMVEEKTTTRQTPTEPEMTTRLARRGKYLAVTAASLRQQQEHLNK